MAHVQFMTTALFQIMNQYQAGASSDCLPFCKIQDDVVIWFWDVTANTCENKVQIIHLC
jgi:hypothetical protein